MVTMLGMDRIRRASGDRCVIDRRDEEQEVERRIGRRRGAWRRLPNAGVTEILIDMPSLRLRALRTSLWFPLLSAHISQMCTQIA